MIKVSFYPLSSNTKGKGDAALFARERVASLRSEAPAGDAVKDLRSGKHVLFET
jgi:hypothetical protein